MDATRTRRRDGQRHGCTRTRAGSFLLLCLALLAIPRRAVIAPRRIVFRLAFLAGLVPSLIRDLVLLLVGHFDPLSAFDFAVAANSARAFSVSRASSSHAARAGSLRARPPPAVSPRVLLFGAGSEAGGVSGALRSEARRGFPSRPGRRQPRPRPRNTPHAEKLAGCPRKPILFRPRLWATARGRRGGPLLFAPRPPPP